MVLSEASAEYTARQSEASSANEGGGVRQEEKLICDDKATLALRGAARDLGAVRKGKPRGHRCGRHLDAALYTY